MKITKSPIIPQKSTLVSIEAKHELDKEALCVFAATGFFLDTDSYWKDRKVVPPASTHKYDTAGNYLESSPWFSWHYTPRDISFKEALTEFTTLFETIIAEQTANHKVILPLSGGLDSRTQAVAFQHLGKKVQAYSYEFKGGYPETKIAKTLATICDFEFQKFEIDKGYLWNVIAELANINGCYSEFTHPRQMAVIDAFETMGTVFSLGHWGDVLFDRGAPEGLNMEQLPDYIFKAVVKKGGLVLANSLWQQWSLEGTFEAYFRKRIQTLLDAIAIDNVSAKMRAFKSLYWAPRWTSTNLSIFAEKHPITLPYYDDRMCQFICTIPEAYLADRKLQIAYIKARNEQAARVTWQAHKPFNLYTFHKNQSPHNIPYRVVNKLQREIKKTLGTPYVQRNWELQFLGKENEKELEKQLFGNALSGLVDVELTKEIYSKFKHEDAVYYSHPVSMLLTLSIWLQNNKDN
ncbi:hypothetical protein SCB49_01637 [unidentified eubacterium SCB49]|nr:hypothetical protein SCB49_01637 [unidentified eubacterium SCB49]